MRKLLVLILVILSAAGSARSQTNVELLDQLVTESQSEHSRQADARTSQAAVSANESVNKTQMTSLKGTYRDIQSRFHTLGLVIDAAEIGFEATPVVNEIITQQAQIITACKNNPALMALALSSENDLADRAYLLADYSLGLVLSIGDIYQMKASDRKMLFSYVVTELRQIDGASRGLLNALDSYNALLNSKQVTPFSSFINQDRSLVDDIMRNAAALKN